MSSVRIPIPMAPGQTDREHGKFVVLLFNYNSSGAWASVHQADCAALDRPEVSERVHFLTRDDALAFARRQANGDVRECGRC